MLMRKPLRVISPLDRFPYDHLSWHVNRGFCYIGAAPPDRDTILIIFLTTRATPAASERPGPASRGWAT